MLIPRPYQHEALTAIRQARADGKRRVLLSLPTGGGKTIIFAHQVVEDAQQGRVLILVHRDELVHQTLTKLHQIAPDLQVGVVKADHNEVDAPVVLASVQTLTRTSRLHQLQQHWQLIIVDECFVAGTRIDGKPIETLRPGDSVRSYNHTTNTVEWQTVRAVMCRTTNALLRLRTLSGRDIVCTPNHPFWTGTTYVRAADLTPGIPLYVLPPADKHADEQSEVRLSSDGSYLLYQGARLHQSQCDQLCDSDGEQPDASRGVTREDATNPQGHWPPSTRTRWQWSSPARTTHTIVATPGPRVDSGICLQDHHTPWGQVEESRALLDRPCPCGRQDCGGNRWWQSWNQSSKSTRYPQGCGIASLWLDRVATVEPYRVDRSGGVLVYNLDVAGNHNYFAEDVLVHNCHHVDGELHPSEGPPTASGVYPPLCLAGNSWVRTLQHCGAWEDSFTVGCTATPYRPNGTSILGPIFEETVYHKHLLHMMLEGYLCDLAVKRLHVGGMDLKRVRTVAGDYSADDLEKQMLKVNAPAQIVSGIQQYAADRRVAIFSPGIAHAEAITALCQARGVTAQTIIGSTPWETRKAAYEAVSTGTLQVLSSVMVLTEGFDLPAIDGIVLARATKSKVLFAQALGRGLRLSPETGKQNCLLLDATGATERHNLFSVAELLGLSEAMLSEEQSILEAVAAPEEAEEEADAPALLTETVQATAVDLVRRAALSWVETPRGAYALSMAGSTFRIRYEDPTRSRWLVELKRKEAKQYQRLETGLPLPYAFGVAEDTARSMGLARATAKEAQWRQRPPSPGQLAVCQKLGIVVDPRWTQGAVSDAITQVIADWYWPPR